jgi:hypothetical protein
MNRSKDRARLRRIEVLLGKHPKGLRESEIARKLKRHRSTVMRDLPVLEETGVLLMEDDKGHVGLFHGGRRVHAAASQGGLLCCFCWSGGKDRQICTDLPKLEQNFPSSRYPESRSKLLSGGALWPGYARGKNP